jgi:hypothetical protein
MLEKLNSTVSVCATAEVPASTDMTKTASKAAMPREQTFLFRMKSSLGFLIEHL